MGTTAWSQLCKTQYLGCLKNSNSKRFYLCFYVYVCVCIHISTTLPLCQDPDVFTITPLRYLVCIEGCQDTVTTERPETACSTGANNIWDQECPQREERREKRQKYTSTSTHSCTVVLSFWCNLKYDDAKTKSNIVLHAKLKCSPKYFIFLI